MASNMGVRVRWLPRENRGTYPKVSNPGGNVVPSPARGRLRVPCALPAPYRTGLSRCRGSSGGPVSSGVRPSSPGPLAAVSSVLCPPFAPLDSRFFQHCSSSDKITNHAKSVRGCCTTGVATRFNWWTVKTTPHPCKLRPSRGASHLLWRRRSVADAAASGSCGNRDRTATYQHRDAGWRWGRT